MNHHVEIFREVVSGLWGWQCFTCGAEEGDFETCPAADAGADEHWASTEGEAS